MNMANKDLFEEVPQSIDLPCIRVEQPIGVFYVATIDSKLLCAITSADVRRMLREREFETYLGIQRPLSQKRIEELSAYVNTIDACFPTSIILAVDGRCAEFVEKKNILRLSNYLDPKDAHDRIHYIQIAKVLDGQHRIDGLRAYKGSKFETQVSVFVDIDIAEQAYLFSTVNLAQTKVNKSLVYDLFDLANSRSPQKSCHNIAVGLDQKEGSPFYKRIKRLGSATPGRERETITQATFVESLIPYVSSEPLRDRDLLKRKKKPARPTESELRKTIFRNMFLDEKDLEIAEVVQNYFNGVRARWPAAWNAGGQGMMLNKTNGFRALTRLLRPAYLYLGAPGDIPSVKDFKRVLEKIRLSDEEFTIDKFAPGTSGEAALFNVLLDQANLRSIR